MPSHLTRRTARACASGAAILALVAATVSAQPDGETLTAQARVSTKGGVRASAPVTVVIRRFASDTDRDALKAALAQGGTSAARALLAKRDDLGTIQVGARRTPIKFAYRQTTAAGHLVTIVTAEPIVFLGAGLPHAPTTKGFDLGFANLEVATAGPGVGELLPATKIRFNADGALTTDGYSDTVIELTNVTGK